MNPAACPLRAVTSVTRARCADAVPLPTMVPDRRGELWRGLRGRREGVASFGLILAPFTPGPAPEMPHRGAAGRRNPRVDGAK